MMTPEEHRQLLKDVDERYLAQRGRDEAAALIPAMHSVCIPCDVSKPLNGARHMTDFDRCPKCRAIMDVMTSTSFKRATQSYG